MTEYESQSLQIATDTYNVCLAGDFIAVFALFAAFFGVWKIIQQLESERWNTLFLFEQDMNNQSRHLVEIFNSTTHGDRRRDEAIQSYLNVVERLALAILKNKLPVSETKKSYRKFIDSTVDNYKDKFGITTDYPRILELYEKWRD